MQFIESSGINNRQTIGFYLYIFLIIYLALWTLAPSLVRFTLPMDALEGTIWGHQLEWGYDKNPFMNGWLTSLAMKLSGSSDWILYFFSQLSVCISLWAVWMLAKKIFPPIYALVGTVLLISTQYYNLHAIDFNDNTLELAFWSLTVLFFYEAILGNKLRDWFLTGVFAAGSMMTKYYSVMLLMPMLFFMLYEPSARKHFKKFPVYIGLTVFIILIAPHLIWLTSHNFVTVNYAVHRVSSDASWVNHFIFPIKFAYEQLQVFIPALILLFVLRLGKKVEEPLLYPWPQKFDQTFLIFVGLGPFVLTVLLAAFTGIKLRAGWGQPLLSYWGLILLGFLKPNITQKRLQLFLSLCAVIFIGVIVSYCIALKSAKKPSSANFPGKEIATTVEKKWESTFEMPIKFIVGPRWLAGNIAFYSKSKPAVYMDADKTVSPWIDETTLKKNGAIFVWDPREDKQVSYEALKARFPKLGKMQTLNFSWLRNKSLPPIEMSFAILPPTPTPHP